jgi:hypothetical protein
MRKLCKADKQVLRLVEDYVIKLRDNNPDSVSPLWRAYLNRAGTVFYTMYPKARS